MPTIALTMDKQIAIAILKKLEALADDAEDSFFLAKQRKCANVAQYDAYMTENREQYAAFRKAFQESQWR